MLDSSPLKVLSSSPLPHSPASTFIVPRVQAPTVLLLRIQELQIPGPSSPRFQELGSPSPFLQQDPEVVAQGFLLSLSPLGPYPCCIYMQGQLPDLHADPDSCGGPALPPVQVPIPALAMTLAASSQRSQIIRSKFRSGERFLFVHQGSGPPGPGNSLSREVCTAG